MAVFFAYERLRVLLRVAVPLALGVDMLHSFYYVGRLVQEKRSLENERAKKQTLHSTVTLFKRTDYSFWPAVVRERIESAALPDMTSLPRPSYELDDEEEETPLQHPKPTLAAYRLQKWASPTQDLPNAPAHPLLHQESDSSAQISPGVLECEMIASEEKGGGTESAVVSLDVAGMVEELYKIAVPYPVRHPWWFCIAVKAALARELRLHLKKSDRYFEAHGMWLRSVLHVPYLIFERRSALRFRVRLAPLPK